MDEEKLYLLFVKSSSYRTRCWDISAKEEYNKICNHFINSPLPNDYSQIKLDHAGVLFFYSQCRDTGIAYFCISKDFNKLDGIRMFHQTTLNCLSDKNRNALYAFESN